MNPGTSKKGYGLFIPKTKATLATKASAVFGGGDDDDSNSGDDNTSASTTTKKRKPTSTMYGSRKSEFEAKLKKQQEIEIEKALAEDPSVFEYDSVYDDLDPLKKERDPKTRREREGMERKPKYIAGLMAAAEKRTKDYERRTEKMIHEERSKEGSEFADKEEYVTSAYKKKMEELKRLEAEERLQEAKDAAADEVRKKGDGFAGFYRHILDARSSRGTGETKEEKVEVKKEEEEEEVATAAASSREDSGDKDDDDDKELNERKSSKKGRHDSSSSSAPSDASPPREAQKEEAAKIRQRHDSDSEKEEEKEEEEEEQQSGAGKEKVGEKFKKIEKKNDGRRQRRHSSSSDSEDDGETVTKKKKAEKKESDDESDDDDDDDDEKLNAEENVDGKIDGDAVKGDSDSAGESSSDSDDSEKEDDKKDGTERKKGGANDESVDPDVKPDVKPEVAPRVVAPKLTLAEKYAKRTTGKVWEDARRSFLERKLDRLKTGFSVVEKSED